jgi:hypothetical protein
MGQPQTYIEYKASTVLRISRYTLVLYTPISVQRYKDTKLQF